MDLADLSALLGGQLPGEGNTDVWVVMPAAGERESGALVAEGRRLADGLGCYLQVVVAPRDDEGNGAAERIIHLGADKVHVSPEPLEYMLGQRPEFVLFPASQGAAAARAAERLGAGLITHAAGPLSIDPETRALSGLRPVYGGDYYQQLRVTAAVKMATVDPADLPLAIPEPGRSGEVIVADGAREAEPESEPPARRLGGVDYQPPAWRPLSKARVIVAAGRGVRDAAGFGLARQLAECLGGEAAGDRAACDAGWVDEAHAVGVTGQEVAPDLYLAIGVQGDTVHNAAITGARRVFAIHANREAPIFRAADLGVVGEPKAVVRRLLELLREHSVAER